MKTQNNTATETTATYREVSVEVTDDISETTYSASLAEDGTVDICQSLPGMSLWAGTGEWDGCAIQDCAAVLGGSQDAADRIYGLLDDALNEALDEE